MHPLLKLVSMLAAYEGTVQLIETKERHNLFNQSRKYCDSVGKQLLRVGIRRSFLEPPNGDVTLDIDPVVENIPGGICADERYMPFEDKEFGVAFNEHTLEHLRSAEDVELAVNECVRVADRAVLLAPSPYSIYASLFCPSHNLRLWFDQQSNTIRVAKNKYRTGLGTNIGYSQHIITNKAPLIMGYGKGFIIS